MKKLLFTAAAVTLVVEASTIAIAQKRTVTCSGTSIEVDMIAGASFPMAVVYDNTDELNPRTCVLDVGRAGHWPLRGACWTGEKCIISGPYLKKSATRTTCAHGTKPKRRIIQNSCGRDGRTEKEPD